jgi:phospholipase/carboxylesterase
VTITLHAPGPHDGQPVVTAGTPLDRAALTAILMHGRGASAESILTLADELQLEEVAYLAPQAAGHAWYPNRFIAPIASNEPWLSSALSGLDSLVGSLAQFGLGADRVALIGFSQGGCLALEYAVRHARRYAGVIGLSAGLIGPPGTEWPAAGSLDGTPAFLGCSDVDAHIPKERVLESAAAFRRLGADVTAILYPQMGHTVNEDEIERVRTMLSARMSPP